MASDLTTKIVTTRMNMASDFDYALHQLLTELSQSHDALADRVAALEKHLSCECDTTDTRCPVHDTEPAPATAEALRDAKLWVRGEKPNERIDAVLAEYDAGVDERRKQ